LTIYVRLCNCTNLWTNWCNLDRLRVNKCVYVITGHYCRICVIGTVWIVNWWLRYCEKNDDFV